MGSAGHGAEAYAGRPIIGIANSWNDFVSCNLPHRELVEHVKRGVLDAGGYPMEFHTMATSADLTKPSDLPYRNLMSMDVEEMIRSLPMDGVVLLAECDKTVPAQLMAAASCDIPALQLAAGHRASGRFRGRTVNYGTDLWRYMQQHDAGELDDAGWAEFERCISCGLGGCPVMGTASTMKSVSEILGMMLPGTASTPAEHPDRRAAAVATGARIVEMVREDLRPSRLMTADAFDNAIRLLGALAGSTNAILHLVAIAGRLGLKLPLRRFDDLIADTPVLVNLQPSGEHGMDRFHEAGGTAAVIRALLPKLHADAVTATGRSLGQEYAQCGPGSAEVIGSLDTPFQASGGLAVVGGSLCPDGAVVKTAAVSAHLRRHRGRAVVFDGYEEMVATIDRDDLEVDASSVLILRNCGPVGAGMPEWGMIPIPRKLARQGVTDMVRVSDARMSGTSYGTVVLHVAPEAAVGGPLCLVRNGDEVQLDLDARTLDLVVPAEELRTRRDAWSAPPSRHGRGFLRLWEEDVLQAPEGCDLRILRPRNASDRSMVEPIVGRS